VRNVSNVGSGNSVSVVRVAAEEYLGREVAYRVAFLSDIFMNNVTIAVAPLLGSDGVISIPLLNRRQRERVNEFYGSILHENFEVQFDEENIQGFPESCTLNLKLRLGLNYKLINVSSGRDFIPSNAKVISCCSGIFFEFCIVDNSRKINVIDTPGVRIVVWRTLNENAYFSTVLGEGDFYHHVFFHAALFVKFGRIVNMVVKFNTIFQYPGSIPPLQQKSLKRLPRSVRVIAIGQQKCISAKMVLILQSIENNEIFNASPQDTLTILNEYTEVPSVMTEEQYLENNKLVNLFIEEKKWRVGSGDSNVNALTPGASRHQRVAKSISKPLSKPPSKSTSTSVSRQAATVIIKRKVSRALSPATTNSSSTGYSSPKPVETISRSRGRPRGNAQVNKSGSGTDGSSSSITRDTFGKFSTVNKEEPPVKLRRVEPEGELPLRQNHYEEAPFTRSSTQPPERQPFAQSSEQVRQDQQASHNELQPPLEHSDNPSPFNTSYPQNTQEQSQRFGHSFYTTGQVRQPLQQSSQAFSDHSSPHQNQLPFSQYEQHTGFDGPQQIHHNQEVPHQRPSNNYPYFHYEPFQVPLVPTPFGLPFYGNFGPPLPHHGSYFFQPPQFQQYASNFNQYPQWQPPVSRDPSKNYNFYFGQ
jgi:hypothetical protein